MRHFKTFHVAIADNRFFESPRAQEAAEIAVSWKSQGAKFYAVSDGYSGIMCHAIPISNTIKATRQDAMKAKRMCASDEFRDVIGA